MPSSAVRTFQRLDEYFAEIRNLQVKGFVERRGEFPAEATGIDLRLLWIRRFNQYLPRFIKVTSNGSADVPACDGRRSNLVFSESVGARA
jgi:hypothetical protein